MADDVIWIVTDDTPLVVLPPGGRDRQGSNPFDDDETESTEQQLSKRGIPVKADKLEAGVTEFLKLIGRVFDRAKQRAGELSGMELDEIELSVEVNGEGQLSLLGSGSKVGGKGAITMRFKTNKTTN
ncbi:MAG TPA: hypothetical protein DCY88_12925 [Cyanobacteria bacterium UBA11372]|nr:hypothetical protein [Cyanobacteria bacterium UBA11372]